MTNHSENTNCHEIETKGCIHTRIRRLEYIISIIIAISTIFVTNNIQRHGQQSSILVNVEYLRILEDAISSLIDRQAKIEQRIEQFLDSDLVSSNLHEEISNSIIVHQEHCRESQSISKHEKEMLVPSKLTMNISNTLLSDPEIELRRQRQRKNIYSLENYPLKSTRKSLLPTKTDMLSNTETPQYKAACWIIFDDVSKVFLDWQLFIERYTLAVLLYTTKQNDQSPFFFGPTATCDYKGIVCDTQGYIKEIIWSSQNIRGTIPSELSYLLHLENLLLNNNRLVGTIPPSIKKLSHLKILSFSDNELTGSIPRSIGDLKSLSGLYLSNNYFEGVIPSEIGRLTHLGILALDNNILEGTIPNELFDCTKLRELSLDSNSLNGHLHPHVEHLQDLQLLNLQRNSLSGQIPSETWGLSSLRKLNLFRNQLSGSISHEFGNLKRIEHMWLYRNFLTGTIPDVFGNFTKLYSITLSRNNLSGLIPKSIWDLDAVDDNFGEYFVLFLDQNNLTGTVPVDFCSKIRLVVTQ